MVTKRYATDRTVRKLARVYPELRQLMDTLEAWGVDVGGAPAIVVALATGSSWYADALAADVATWRRYHAAVRALRDCECPFDLCDVVIGALAWTYIDGSRFVDLVTRRAAAPAPAMH